MGALLLGLALRLAPIADDPLHPDECLYASWALAIADGSDPWLRLAALDKPPLYPYLLAGWSKVVGPGPVALRMLGIASALAGLMAFSAASKRLYGPAPALAGLVMMALSPAAVALDGTALTDQPAIALALAALLASLRGSGVAAGLLFGLALATKPQLLAFLPLILAALISRRRQWREAALGVAVVASLVLSYELVRQAPAGFADMALRNYGRDSSASSLPWLAREWLAVLRWSWADPRAMAFWATVCLGGLVTVLLNSVTSMAIGDSVAAGAALSLLLYLGANVVFGAPAWDRYTLVAVPLLAMLFAWAVARISASLRRGYGLLASAILALAMATLLLRPAQEAAFGRLPVGDTSRWQGIETVAAYLRGQVPGRATLLYQEFGWHLRYYARGFTQDLRWFRDDAQLLAEAERAEPGYVLLPADAGGRRQLALLREAGFSIETVLTAYRHDGSPSMYLLRLAGRPV